MSYTCYLGGALWPTPEKLQVKIKGKNKTLVLLNEGEVNFLRAPGLTELTVPFDLPMLTGSRSPDYYLGLLEQMKANKETTQFMLVRMSPSGGMLFDTNIKVSVEDYNITEDGKKGLDVAVDVNLKQWRDYRPIDQSHAGTLEDPIPWVYGMDCHAGVYFSYQGHIYQVAEGGDMVPCVWAPGTAGLWQWVLIE